MEGFVVSAPQQSIQSGRKDSKTKKSIPEGCFSEKDGTQGHYNICKFDLCKFKQYIWGKHGSIEITQSEAQRENKWEKQEQSLETCEKITNRLPYLSVIEYQKEKRVKMGQNKYLKRMFLIDKRYHTTDLRSLESSQTHYMCVCVCVCAQMLSHVGLSVTSWTIAHQAPLSMGVSRQEYCSGLP